MKNMQNCATKELVDYLNFSNEALRIENLRLLDQVERLTMEIEVIDAEEVCNVNAHYNEFINNFNKQLKQK